MADSIWQKGIRRLRKRYIFNIYLLVGSLSIVVATTIFTIRVSKRVERQSYLTTELISGVASRLLVGDGPEEMMPVIKMINETSVPIILTDNGGRPIFWNSPVIGVPLPEFQTLQNVNISTSKNPVIQEILHLVETYDQTQQPFAIITPDGLRVGTLHYGSSALSRQLQVMPYLQLMVMALFFLVILWALQGRKEAEQKALFAGMAKETAHQLGTPLTSIMGWVALLEDRVGKTDDVMVELNRDVNRLSMISARFSQIGSMPKLDDSDINEMIDEVIVYFRRRLPHLGGRVQLRREGVVAGHVVFNRDLLGWVLENLIRNGVDALVDGKGTITLHLEDRDDGGVTLLVTDTGKGIPARVGNKVFEPGFTTKKRGWGMGLALVKRIVTQYHGGRLSIKNTSSHGTTFEVVLPPAPVAAEPGPA